MNNLFRFYLSYNELDYYSQLIDELHRCVLEDPWAKIILKYTKYAMIVRKIADFINVGPMQN